MGPAADTRPAPLAPLALLITVGFFAVLFTLMLVEVKPSMKDPLMLMLGALMSAFAGVIGYYFGSTAGAARKDETIRTLATSPTSPAVGGDNPEKETPK